MKILHEMHVFCLAVLVELTAEWLTDYLHAQTLVGGIVVILFIVWFRKRPHFPWRNPWDSDDWI